MAFPQPSDFNPLGIPVGHVYTNPFTKTQYEWMGTHWSVYHPPGSPGASKDFAVSTPSNVEPTEPNDGDFWYDTTDEKLQVRYDDQWIETVGDAGLVRQFVDPAEYNRTYVEQYYSRSWNSEYGYLKLDSSGNTYGNSSSSYIDYGISLNIRNVPEAHKDFYKLADDYNEQIQLGNIRVKAVLQFTGGEYKTRTLSHVVKYSYKNNDHIKLRWNNTTTYNNKKTLYNITYILEDLRPTPDPIPLSQGYRQILKPNIWRDDDNQVQPKAGPTVNNTDMWIYTSPGILSNKTDLVYYANVAGVFIPFGWFEKNYDALKGNYVDVKYLTNFETILFYNYSPGSQVVITKVSKGNIYLSEHNGIKGIGMTFDRRSGGSWPTYSNLKASPEFIGLIEVSVVWKLEEYQRQVRLGNESDVIDYQFKPYDNL